MSTPIRRIRSASFARAVSGQAAAPASSAMKSRRFTLPIPAPRNNNVASFDRLISRHLHRQRHRKTERLCGLEIDDKLERGRLGDREIGWLLAFENPRGVATSSPIGIRLAGSIA